MAGDAQPCFWGHLGGGGGGITLSLPCCSCGQQQPQTSSRAADEISTVLRGGGNHLSPPFTRFGGLSPPSLGRPLGSSSSPISCTVPSSKMSHFCAPFFFFSLLATLQFLNPQGFCHKGQAIQQGGQQRIIQNKTQKVLHHQLPLCGRTMLILFSPSWGNWGLERGGDLLGVAGIITQAYFLLNISVPHSRARGPATEHRGVVSAKLRALALLGSSQVQRQSRLQRTGTACFGFVLLGVELLFCLVAEMWRLKRSTVGRGAQ